MDSDDSDSDSDSDVSLGSPVASTSALPSTSAAKGAGAFMPASARGTADPTRLFAPEELAVIGANTDVLDRKRQKALQKKERKRRAAAERLELELTGDMLGMDVDEGFRREMDAIELPQQPQTKKQKLEKRKKKKQQQKLAERQKRQQQAALDPEFPDDLGGGRGDGMDEDMDAARKESDFANFLAQMGADEDEEL